jgi:excisionase family DNA binding protein
MDMNGDAKTYTVDKAAQMLGIGRAAAYRAAHRGEIPSVKIGGRLLVLSAPLHRMLDGDPSTISKVAKD